MSEKTSGPEANIVEVAESPILIAIPKAILAYLEAEARFLGLNDELSETDLSFYRGEVIDRVNAATTSGCMDFSDAIEALAQAGVTLAKQTIPLERLEQLIVDLRPGTKVNMKRLQQDPSFFEEGMVVDIQIIPYVNEYDVAKPVLMVTIMKLDGEQISEIVPVIQSRDLKILRTPTLKLL